MLAAAHRQNTQAELLFQKVQNDQASATTTASTLVRAGASG